MWASSLISAASGHAQGVACSPGRGADRREEAGEPPFKNIEDFRVEIPDALRDAPEPDPKAADSTESEVPKGVRKFSDAQTVGKTGVYLVAILRGSVVWWQRLTLPRAAGLERSVWRVAAAVACELGHVGVIR